MGLTHPSHRRYEWAAKYLLQVPLKEIAGADAEASTVGVGSKKNRAIAGRPIKK